jgi:hypothetical protein
MPSLTHGLGQTISRVYEVHFMVLTELLDRYGPRSVMVERGEPRPESENPHNAFVREGAAHGGTER